MVNAVFLSWVYTLCMEKTLRKPRFDPETQAILDELLTWDKKEALVWALDTAEHVLYKFTDCCPNDPRPFNCITIGREWLNGTVPFKTVRATALAAHAAARSVSDPSAIAAARACGHAIATIHVQTHCIGAALYGLKACPDEVSKKAERKWQLDHLAMMRNNRKNHEN